MIPGTFSKLSESTMAAATTIAPQAEFVRLTGTTAIATISPPPNGGFATVLFLLPLDGSVATTTAGNIIAVQTFIQNRVAVLVYSAVTGKWYPHALA